MGAIFMVGENPERRKLQASTITGSPIHSSRTSNAKQTLSGIIMQISQS